MKVKGVNVLVVIMNKFKNITYRELWTGDFDNDGVPNIDDSKPFDGKNKNPVNKEVSLKKAYIDLENRRNNYSKDIQILAKKINASSYRVKDQYSSIGKQIGRNIVTLEDAGGLRVLTNNRKDTYNSVEKIKKTFPRCSKNVKDNCIKEIDDKIKTNKKNNFRNPYMAIHLNIKFRKKPFEVQVKCRKQQDIQDKMHIAYKKGLSVSKYRKDAIKLYKKGC